MKSLFDSYEQWTPAADVFGKRVWKAVKPLVDEMVAEGYSLREIEYILHAEISGSMSARVLMVAVAKKRAERAQERSKSPSVEDVVHLRDGGSSSPHCGGTADDDVGKPGYRVTSKFSETSCLPCRESAAACSACRESGVFST